ncbi:hypothetical protein E2C01_063963 [Portunus trituberculatus]|uniref:Uncharacterized protein n=1 Tax=Portunus trituberculatus TaxID=210409 RepID=A0A5B7HF25_PORTR|nr:hypothetical protein [Portunus trituberculatus]
MSLLHVLEVNRYLRPVFNCPPCGRDRLMEASAKAMQQTVGKGTTGTYDLWRLLFLI